MRRLFKQGVLLAVLISTSVCANDPSPLVKPTAASGNQPAAPGNETVTEKTDPTPGPKIYKWVDDQGVTHYGDQAPSEDIAPVELPPIEVMKNPLGENAATPSADSSAPLQEISNTDGAAQTEIMPQYTVSISAPKNNETVLRSQDGNVFVSLSINTPLLANHHVALTLDGKTVSEQSGGAMVVPVSSGMHTLQASIIDINGDALAQSEQISFKVVEDNWIYRDGEHRHDKDHYRPSRTPTPSPVPTPTRPHAIESLPGADKILEKFPNQFPR